MHGKINASVLKLKTKSIKRLKCKGGFITAATSNMELFVIIVNGFQPLTIITKCSINYYHKVLHLGCCSSPGSVSRNQYVVLGMLLSHIFDKAQWINFRSFLKLVSAIFNFSIQMIVLKKCFLFDLKIFFHSQYIKIFALPSSYIFPLYAIAEDDDKR